MPGWEILDAIERPGVDHVGDARDLSRFPDQTFGAIYASHVVEHFDYKSELQTALAHWHRVLAPRGTLYVSVPDLDALAELFLLRESLSRDDRWMVMRMIFGGHMDAFDYHQAGLNEEFLRHFLTYVGFVDIERVEDFALFEDTSTHLFKGIPISVNLVARTPG
jgi:predicted SAM-dependent methyltransferase